MSLFTDHILTWIIFLPTIGAVLCLLAPQNLSRRIAMIFTFATLVVGASLFKDYLPASAETEAATQQVFGASYGVMKHVERAEWITGDKFKIEYYLGIDGLSFPLTILNPARLRLTLEICFG